MNNLFDGTSMRRRRDGCSELIGTVAHILFQSPDKSIVYARLDDDTFVKGEQDSIGISVGVRYRFLGQFQEGKRGREFRWDTFVRDIPHDPEGVVKYLAELCPGIGPVKAAVLVDALGTDAAAIIRENPALAAEHAGLTMEQAEAAAAALEKSAATEATRIDLFALLKGRGFSQKLIQAAIDKWGVRAAETIQRNPYAPMLSQLPSAGFKRCDKLYLDLGRDPNRLKRQALCLLYALRSDSSGNTWLSADVCARAVVDAVGRDAARPVEAAILLKRCRKISVRRDDATPPAVWIAEADKARDEWLISENLRRLMRGVPRWPQLSCVESISEHQSASIGLHISTSPVWLLLGTPGTGKTFVAAAIVKAAVNLFGRERIAVAAPTGKAAVRITAALAEYGVRLDATTIHRLLGVERNGHDGNGWGFKFNWKEPLPFKLVVVDESSMVDTSLMASLVQACANGTNLLFVGDVNQLPPVGHGSPLRDMIAAGIPSAELTEIRRNAGRIVHACRDIKEGKRFTVSERFNSEAGENLIHRETSNGAESLECLLSLLKQFRDREMFDAIWECQVLCALNETGDVSRNKLNVMLQAVLNPYGKTAPRNPFRQGDKIICLRNGAVPQVQLKTKDSPPADAASWYDTNDSCFVANGDIGRALCIADGFTIAKFMYPDRFCKVLHGKKSGGGGDSASGDNGVPESSSENAGDASEAGSGDFDLAYAISVHKSQGSESSCVLLMIDDSGSAKRVCSREWYYTGISRAKRLCILIGDRKVLDKHCRKVNILKRKTFLVELIKEPAS